MTTFTTTAAAEPPSAIPPVTTPTIALTGYNFTSRQEIENLYSTVGVELRLDDMDSLDADSHMDDIVVAATQTVASYTLRFYANEAIYNTQWVRRRATIIGAYYLSMRRANGTQFNAEYQRIMEELQMFLKYPHPMIPGNDGYPAPVRTSNIPTASAYIVDDRNRRRKLRTNKDYTTKSYPSQYQYWQMPSGEVY